MYPNHKINKKSPVPWVWIGLCLSCKSYKSWLEFCKVRAMMFVKIAKINTKKGKTIKFLFS